MKTVTVSITKPSAQSVSIEMPETVAEAIEVFGEDSVMVAAKRSWDIAIQAALRAAFTPDKEGNVKGKLSDDFSYGDMGTRGPRGATPKAVVNASDDALMAELKRRGLIAA